MGKKYVYQFAEGNAKCVNFSAAKAQTSQK